MAQADSLKETSTFEGMNGQLQLFSSNKLYTTSKNEPLKVVFWKNILHLQKFDASNRSYSTIAVPKTYKALNEN